VFDAAIESAVVYVSSSARSRPLGVGEGLNRVDFPRQCSSEGVC
jgi:hypothetical protein